MQKINLNELETPNNSEQTAIFCAAFAKDKLAKDIIILNLKNIDTAVTDYFVILTSESEAQSEAIFNLLIEKCKDYSITKPKIEGTDFKEWIVLDFFDVVVHIMLPKVRKFYNIEKLWGDAEFSILDDDFNYKSLSNENLVKLFKENI